MDPSEVEFLAEKEFVTVVPNFALDKIYLIGVSDRFCIFNLNFFWVFLKLLYISKSKYQNQIVTSGYNPAADILKN